MRVVPDSTAWPAGSCPRAPTPLTGRGTQADTPPPAAQCARSAVARLLVILRQTFAYLARRDAHHRIGPGVVVSLPAVHVDGNTSFFDFRGPAFQRALYHIAQECRIPFAVPEMRARQNQFQFLHHLRRVNRIDGGRDGTGLSRPGILFRSHSRTLPLGRNRLEGLD